MIVLVVNGIPGCGITQSYSIPLSIGGGLFYQTNNAFLGWDAHSHYFWPWPFGTTAILLGILEHSGMEV